MTTNNTNVSDANLGCDVCRQSVYSGSAGLVKVAVRPDGPTFLYQCQVCGTYWNYTINHAYPLTRAKAQEIYPLAFNVAA